MGAKTGKSDSVLVDDHGFLASGVKEQFRLSWRGDGGTAYDEGPIDSGSDGSRSIEQVGREVHCDRGQQGRSQRDGYVCQCELRVLKKSRA